MALPWCTRRRRRGGEDGCEGLAKWLFDETAMKEVVKLKKRRRRKREKWESFPPYIPLREVRQDFGEDFGKVAS